MMPMILTVIGISVICLLTRLIFEIFIISEMEELANERIKKL